MKSIITLFSAMLACLFLFSGLALALAGDDVTCSRKNPDVVNALGKFCQNRAMVQSSL